MRLAARIACLGFAALLLTAVASARQVNPAGPGIKNPALLDANRPPQRELQTNVPDGFTVTAVGDLIISRPLSQYAARDPHFKAVLDALHGTDVLYGNLETTIFDARTFKGYPYSFEGDWTNSSLPSVARDLRTMGFDLVSRANNHSFDWGLEGMRETNEWLNRAGIAYAGVGEDRALARAAAYFESSKARVGLVSFASTYRPTTDALPAQGAAPARPGLSALAVSEIVDLPPGDMQSLARVSCNLYRVGCGEVPPTIALFGNSFKTSDTFHYEYSVDPEDLAGIEAAIRSGKQNGDFLIAAIHSHECSVDCDDPNKAELPAGFLRGVAHGAIDSGADVFVTTGIHNLGPIEIYRGRPIFYGLRQLLLERHSVAPAPRSLSRECRAAGSGVCPSRTRFTLRPQRRTQRRKLRELVHFSKRYCKVDLHPQPARQDHVVCARPWIREKADDQRYPRIGRPFQGTGDLRAHRRCHASIWPAAARHAR
jgi:poly-gamma-glutamate capsule biosynthesis protein CapA/YwtB (metallophosphatase superfamily)